jgi:hypothetical protein
VANIAILIKRLLGSVLYRAGDLNYSNNELLVVNYHSTPKKFIPDFTAQVAFFEKHFDILHPNDLTNYFSGELPVGKKPRLLFTFDDGLLNNLHAAQVLEERGHRGFFFIVPSFVNAPPSEQKDFYLQFIRPVIDNSIDELEEDFTAMSWSQLQELLSKQHSVGCHTMTHTMTAEDQDEKSAEEIVYSKQYLASVLNTTIDAFCSINNTLFSVNTKQKAMIASHYRFHFTTLPGLNCEEANPHFILRRNIECYWPKGQVLFAMGKMDLKRWATRRDAYRRMR